MENNPVAACERQNAPPENPQLLEGQDTCSLSRLHGYGLWVNGLTSSRHGEAPA